MHRRTAHGPRLKLLTIANESNTNEREHFSSHPIRTTTHTNGLNKDGNTLQPFGTISVSLFNFSHRDISLSFVFSVCSRKKKIDSRFLRASIVDVRHLEEESEIIVDSFSFRLILTKFQRNIKFHLIYPNERKTKKTKNVC